MQTGSHLLPNLSITISNTVITKVYNLMSKILITACKTAWLRLLVLGVMNACFCNKIYIQTMRIGLKVYCM